MRSKHGRVMKTATRKVIGKEGRKLLEDYYVDHKWPNLEDIKSLSKMVGVTKETVYWWFRNRRQKHSQDVRIKQEKSFRRARQTSEEAKSVKRQRLSGSHSRPSDAIFNPITKGGKTSGKRDRGTKRKR